MIPEKEPKFLVDFINSEFSCRAILAALKEFGNTFLNLLTGGRELWMICVHSFGFCRTEIIGNTGANNKVTVSKTLHKSTGTKPIGSMIRKVTFSNGKKTWNCSHQVIIHPESTHSIMYCRIYHHGFL